MAEPTRTIRITAEALEWVRVTAGLTGETLSAYASRALAERGREDFARLSAERLGFPKPPRRRPPKPKGEGKPEG